MQNTKGINHALEHMCAQLTELNHNFPLIAWDQNGLMQMITTCHSQLRSFAIASRITNVKFNIGHLPQGIFLLECITVFDNVIQFMTGYEGKPLWAL